MSKPFRTLDDADVAGKRVLLRVDLNVPTESGRVTDATRIERIAPTIAEIADKGGKVILLAHFGRPKGSPDEANSLKPIAAAVAHILKRPVAFATDCIGKTADDAIAKMRNGDVLLLENTRFHKGEEKNDPAHVDALAKLGDVYVNDAFSAAHRAHATTHGLAHKLPSHAGRAMQKELEALEAALGSPKRPVAAIVGGAKVSTKLELLGNLVNKVDVLIIGGGLSGLTTAARLRQQGVQSIRIVEKGADFGGTWYWNRYPGAACDIESYIYLPLLEELDYVPSEKYAKAPEIYEFCRKIARFYDLYRTALLQTTVTGLRWDSKAARWILSTNRSDRIAARFAVVAPGILSQPKLPRIPGIETFAGHPGLQQTCRLEENVLVSGKGPVIFTMMEHMEEAFKK